MFAQLEGEAVGPSGEAAAEPSLELPGRRSGAEGPAGRHQERKKKLEKKPHLRFLKAPIWRLHMARVAQSRSQTDGIFKEPAACRQEGRVERDCLLKKADLQ